MDLEWKIWIPLLSVLVGAFGAWGGNLINGFFTTRAHVLAAGPTIQAAAQKAATDAQAALLSGLTTFVEKLQAERKELLDELRSQGAEIKAQRSYIDALTNKVTDLSSHIDSLERQMREHGLTPPRRPTWERRLT